VTAFERHPLSRPQYCRLLARAIESASCESPYAQSEYVANRSLNLLPYLRRIARNARLIKRAVKGTSSGGWVTSNLHAFVGCRIKEGEFADPASQRIDVQTSLNYQDAAGLATKILSCVSANSRSLFWLPVGSRQRLVANRDLVRRHCSESKVSSAGFDVDQIEPNTLWPFETEENLLRRFG
jgi:hypothetical protein